VSGRLVCLGLLHSLWIGLFVASVVALAFQVRPSLSHESRHWVVLAALLLVATGPVVATLLHYNVASRPKRKAPPGALTTVVSEFGKSLELPSASDGEPSRSATETKDHPARSLSIVIPAMSQLVTIVHRYQPIVVAAWLIGMFALGAVLTLGSTAVLRLCREARPAPAVIRERTLRLARRAGLRKPPRVMVNRRSNEPCLCGLFRPVILLPTHWLECGDARLLDAILAHELAHARRLDHVVNLAQRLLEVAMFFSPGVHWLSRSLRRQREFCADALAVRLTRDPLALAEALESVARHRLSSPIGPAPGSALGGHTASLLSRIQELLGMTPSRPRPHVWPYAALPAAGLIAVLAAASGLSQEKRAEGNAVVQTERKQNGDTDGPPAKSRSPSGSELHQPLSAPPEQQTDRKIGYRVRYYDLTAEMRRGLMKDRPVLQKHESNVSAWIVDALELDDMIGHLQNRNAREIFDDPEIITLENAMIKIRTYNSGKVFPPTEEDGVIGSAVEIAGSTTANRSRLTIELGVLAPEPRHRPFDTTVGGDALKITISKPFRRISCGVPDGSSLAISMALYQREGHDAESFGGTGAARQPQIKARPRAEERLFLITPRPIPPRDAQSPSPAIKGFFDNNPRNR
jgi:beta-lactamase regulating signal transducer with metallopeptidase domain